MAGLNLTHWRGVCVVVLAGDVDVSIAAELGRRLARLQRESSVFVDLWDVTALDSLCLSVLQAAIRRAADTGHRFAVIAPHGGLAAQQIVAAGLQDELHPYETKHDALDARRHHR